MAKVTKKAPIDYGETPKFQAPTTGAGFILGIFVWIFAVIAFVFFLYIAVISQNLQYLIHRFLGKSIIVPFLVSLIVGIFIPPLALIIILLGLLLRAIDKA